MFLSKKTSLSLVLFSVGFKVPGLSSAGAARWWADMALPGVSIAQLRIPHGNPAAPWPPCPSPAAHLAPLQLLLLKKKKKKKAFPVISAGPWSSSDAAAQSKTYVCLPRVGLGGFGWQWQQKAGCLEWRVCSSWVWMGKGRPTAVFCFLRNILVNHVSVLNF